MKVFLNKGSLDTTIFAVQCCRYCMGKQENNSKSESPFIHLISAHSLKIWISQSLGRKDFTLLQLLSMLLFSCLVMSDFCDPMECSTPGLPSFTISQSLLKFMSIALVMPSSHLIRLCPAISCHYKQENLNQNCKDISARTCQDDYDQKIKEKIQFC